MQLLQPCIIEPFRVQWFPFQLPLAADYYGSYRTPAATYQAPIFEGAESPPHATARPITDFNKSTPLRPGMILPDGSRVILGRACDRTGIARN
ncbi:MAG: hypothetical protein R3C28_16050 [Pirellulaceae bacterium]